MAESTAMATFRIVSQRVFLCVFIGLRCVQLVNVLHVSGSGSTEAAFVAVLIGATGATLAECARTLRAAGAESVACVTAALTREKEKVHNPAKE